PTLAALRADDAAFAGAQVAAEHRAVLALVVDQVRVFRIDAADEAVAAADTHPVFIDRADAAHPPARPAPAAVVLQTAVDPVRLLVADRNVIKLAQRRLVEVVPVSGAVVGDVQPAIAADEHVPAIARVDPQGVAVGVDALTSVAAEDLAAVVGAEL